MILHELCNLYDRMANDTESEIALYGYVAQGVAYELVIGSSGELLAINDIRVVDGKKAYDRQFNLPGTPKPSGSGSNPTINGWDRTDYMLGYLDPESFKPAELDKRLARCERSHKDYKEVMLGRESEVNHPSYSAFCRFLESWDPASAVQYPVLKEVSGKFGVVRLQNEKSYLHDIDAVGNYKTESSADENSGMCLISGNEDTIARIHSVKIKNVNKAQPAGASLVSFNCKSFESYGHDQSFNAPVSERAAFKYATALNSLLARGSKRRILLGDATCVFWADAPTIGEDIFGAVLSGDPPSDENLQREIEDSLISIKDGKLPRSIESDTGFYVLGLAPNEARLSVRFWYDSTLGKFLERVVSFQQELDIVRSVRDRDILPVWLLLLQTARESKEVPPLLGGALMRAILTGGNYPVSLYQAVLRRLQVDKDFSHPKAAIIKAILLRNYKKEGLKMLEKDRTEPGYQTGRLFAALEWTQEKALGSVNSGIRGRYYSSASSTPQVVFPRLIRQSQHHLAKLEGGLKVNSEKIIQEICGRINAFPSHLGLEEQGLFALGYYHQRQSFFTPKNNDDSAAEENV